MKVGRELLKAGRVVAANYEPPLLTGEVREGQKIYRAGLRVRTATDVENICTCREARQWGAVCAGDGHGSMEARLGRRSASDSDLTQGW